MHTDDDRLCAMYNNYFKSVRLITTKWKKEGEREKMDESLLLVSKPFSMRYAMQ